ncbi:MAG TPA: hypothetical protein PKD64_16530 [Pirellulaceae bacterium]|nr:hypothetical protein [Pirellulaceae bacterium]HMO93797.1 hypothetical protein [Pirellulaceae bacterium]HMP70609.1 hypothetical protein [Pirellulaceae bacterium]
MIRYIVSLATVTTCYVVYATLFAPLIDGEPMLTRSHERDIVTENTDPMRNIRHLFRPNAWELQPCNVLETRQGILLYRDHERLPDGRVEVVPLTLVVSPSKPDEQPFVIQAETGAVLQFDKPFSFTEGIGHIEKGNLNGRVHIYRFSTSLQKDDSIDIVTSDVQLSPEQIFTHHDVAFRMGDSHGQGRNLIIQLEEKSNHEGDSHFPVKRVDLHEVDYIHLSGISTPARRPHDPLATSNQGAFLNEDTKSTDQQNSMPFKSIDITCTQGFQLDVENLLASFKGSVRAVDSTDQNELECDLLWVYFSDVPQSASGEHQPSNLVQHDASRQNQLGEGTLKQSFKVKEIIALGQPARLISRQNSSLAEAEHLQLNLETNRVSLRGRNPVLLASENQRLLAAQLDYAIERDNSLGETTALGPGQLVQQSTTKAHETEHHLTPARDGTISQTSGFECHWLGRMLIRPENGMKRVDFEQGTTVSLDDGSVFSGDNVQLWLLELPQVALPARASHDTSASLKSRFRYAPHRMFAMGNVMIHSPKLRGTCNTITLNWPKPTDELHLGLHESRVGEILSSKNTSANDRNEQTDRDMVTTIRIRPTQSPFGNLLQQTRSARSYVNKLIVETAMRQIIKQGTSDVKFHFTGDEVSIQMEAPVLETSDQGSRENRISELTVVGNVSVVQQNESQEVRGLSLQGHHLLAIHLGDQLFRLSISGTASQPAEVEGQGISLVGPSVHLDQRYNRLWIEGEGEANFAQQESGNNGASEENQVRIDTEPQISWRTSNSDNRSSTGKMEDGNNLLMNPSVAAGGPINLQFSGGLLFDGQTIYLEDHVRTEMRRLETNGNIVVVNTTSQTFNARLDQFINFTQGNEFNAVSARINKIVLHGTMEADSRVFKTIATNQPRSDRMLDNVVIHINQLDENENPASSQTIVVPEASIDHESSLISCLGPGMVRGIQVTRNRTNGPRTNRLIESTRDTLPFEYVQIKFERELKARMNQHDMIFLGGVRLLYSPVSRWDASFNADQKHIPDPGGLRLLCDSLQLFQWQPRTSKEPIMEMIAKGNAQAFGQQFEANADRISYNQATENLILQAGERRDAELNYANPGQSDRGHLTAVTINYNITTGEIQVDRYKQIDVNHEGPKRLRK